MELRAARAEDYEAFGRFWRQLFDEQPVPDRDTWLATLCPNTMFLEDEGGTPVAYNLAFAFGTRGDVRQVVVDRAVRRRGVGRALMVAVATKLRAAGCTNWRLEVDTTNVGAIALYESLGMRCLHVIEGVELDVAACARFAALRSNQHTVVAVMPAEDAELEHTLDLGAGQIQRWRTARAGMPLVRVGMTGLAQLWSDFLPQRGLLFPFLAPDVDVAAHLVHAAPPKPYEISVVGSTIHAALLACGARPVHQQLEYGGEL